MLTNQDFLAWLARAAAGMDMARLKDLLRTKGRSFPLPRTAIDAFDLARFLSAQWGDQKRVLLTLENSIFTEAEELELYNSYVQTVAGRLCEGGEALVFEPNTSSFTTVLAMHIIFRWDCIVGSSDQRFLEVSHDDLLCAHGFDESFYETLAR